MLEYKTKWYVRKLIKVSKYYSSNQLYNCCGYRNKELKNYNIRNQIYANGREYHGRNFNTANNILNKEL